MVDQGLARELLGDVDGHRWLGVCWVGGGSACCEPDGGRPNRVWLGCVGLLLPGLERLQLWQVWAGFWAGRFAAIQGPAELGIGAEFHGCVRVISR
jgi:hypothetical protein